MRTIYPRAEFLTSPTAQPFGDLITNPVFVVGVRAALLEFVTQESRARGWEEAAQSHHYTQGAKDFAQYLLTFLDQAPVKPKPTNENLKWPTKESLQQHRQPQPKAAGK